MHACRLQLQPFYPSILYLSFYHFIFEDYHMRMFNKLFSAVNEFHFMLMIIAILLFLTTYSSQFTSLIALFLLLFFLSPSSFSFIFIFFIYFFSRVES